MNDATLSTTESRIIVVIGMKTRVFPFEIRMSPGNRPNHDSAPVMTTSPTTTAATPSPTISNPAERASIASCYRHSAMPMWKRLHSTCSTWSGWTQNRSGTVSQYVCETWSVATRTDQDPAFKKN